MNWTAIQHFRPSEFDSPDAEGSGQNMDVEFVAKLDRIRGRCGFAFHVNSGYRTAKHNAEVGGKSGSAHPSGHAADIECRTSWQRYRILQESLKEGIKRIGLADTFVHLDDAPSLPQEIIWTY